jgi:hypothetical protein
MPRLKSFTIFYFLVDKEAVGDNKRVVVVTVDKNIDYLFANNINYYNLISS